MNCAPPIRKALFGLVLVATGVASIGCGPIPGKPGPGPEVVRPEDVVDFPVLYKQNCAACHGDNGRYGAAISLANPVYIALAGENRLQTIIANGVPGKLMPAFAKSAGGMLTDGQVSALAQGIDRQWGNSNVLAGQNPPPYLATLHGNVEDGLRAYQVFCARCHGTDGEGGPADGIANSTKGKLGPIVDPSYLALISDQSLRNIIIAGRPDESMPDWRNDAAQSTPAKPLTDLQITDIVAWLASKRIANPGQPYFNKP
jgi:mono/diheme cytochrome c family protein